MKDWHGLGTVTADASHAYDYDWVYHANHRGYPTIAIDRIGNGYSSRPDPKVVQYSLEVEVITNLPNSCAPISHWLRNWSTLETHMVLSLEEPSLDVMRETSTLQVSSK